MTATQTAPATAPTLNITEPVVSKLRTFKISLLKEIAYQLAGHIEEFKAEGVTLKTLKAIAPGRFNTREAWIDVIVALHHKIKAQQEVKLIEELGFGTDPETMTDNGSLDLQWKGVRIGAIIRHGNSLWYYFDVETNFDAPIYGESRVDVATQIKEALLAA